jgi:hypothetical protein
MLDASLVPNSSNINILAVNSSAHCPLIHKGLGTGMAAKVTGLTVAVGILKAASAGRDDPNNPDKVAMATIKLNGGLPIVTV